MPESTSEQRKNWVAYECQAGKMVRIQFGPDSILVAPPTVDAWAALAAVMSGHGYVLRTPDTDSYNCRAIKGGGGRSLHSYGIALDVNWDTNPYKETPDQRAVRFSSKSTQGERGEDVRLGKADTDMTPAMIADVLAIKTKAGKKVFEWGGNWKTVKDTMHFEIDVTPEDMASGIDPKTIGGGPELPPAATARPILKRGSIGEQVRLVQTVLMIDGIFGGETESAVMRFQRFRGLEVDGIVGDDTWGLIEPLLPHAEPAPVGEWQTSIEATNFGGTGDEQPVAYADVARGWPSRLGVSLPDRFEGARPMVEVENIANGRSAVCPIVDVGPWMISDDYWRTNARPIAETCYVNRTPLPSGPNQGKVPTNKAGIDLTPATDEAIGLNGKGLVRWRLVQQGG